MITYNLVCTKCRDSFSLEMEEKDPENSLSEPKQGKVFCPKCGQPAKVIGRESFNMGKSEVSQKRHANEAASEIALKQAAQQRIQDSMEDGRRMIPVTGPDGRSQEMVPERVVKGLEEKFAPLLED